MWLMTAFGFFSIVQKTGQDFLTVRARVREDLDTLREHYLPTLSPTQAKSGTDYPWRATVAHPDLAQALGRIVLDLHYPNFKSEVARTQGKQRAHTYGQVWQTLYDLPPHAPDLAAPGRSVAPTKDPWMDTLPAGTRLAYGGVVVNAQGQILLREPKNHFDGYHWTFAKGRPDPGETPHQTALREVLEETGVRAEILCPIPGDFDGGTTLNRYYLMRPTALLPPTQHSCKETQSIRWVTPEAAVALLKKTENSIGRKRDLAVLAAAKALLGSSEPSLDA